jgi:hypothetical protein
MWEVQAEGKYDVDRAKTTSGQTEQTGQTWSIAALPTSIDSNTSISTFYSPSTPFNTSERGSRSSIIMAETSDNPLLSTKPSDSGISVSLHPLVLLTASDQITRHRVRGDSGPIVGILLGQQDGRQITAEHAFAAGTATDESTGKLIFKQPWLNERVQQCMSLSRQAEHITNLF